MKEFIEKYWKYILAVIIVMIIIAVVYIWWGKKEENTIRVVDDRGNPVDFTAEERNTATAIAGRIHDDLNSGWFFGMNIWGVVGRDDEAYTTLATMSDAMFSLTCQIYQEKYKTSLITDLRAESSIGQQYKDLILQKADKLKIK